MIRCHICQHPANATLIDENAVENMLLRKTSSILELDIPIKNWIHITRILTKGKNLINLDTCQVLDSHYKDFNKRD